MSCAIGILAYLLIGFAFFLYSGETVLFMLWPLFLLYWCIYKVIDRD